ncbi:MAG: hypothetical protein ACRYFS_18860 [Janthinobacterium lividum]
MSIFNFFVRFNQPTAWITKSNQTEIISRRPIAQRIVFGFYAGFLVCLTYKVVTGLLPLLSDSAAWGAIAFIVLALVSLILCFLLGAGPRQMLLNLEKQEYSLKRGFPFLTWTTQGTTSEGKIYVSETRSGSYQVRFQAQGWRGGLPIEFFETKADAHSTAREIASKIGLSTRCVECL